MAYVLYSIDKSFMWDYLTQRTSLLVKELLKSLNKSLFHHFFNYQLVIIDNFVLGQGFKLFNLHCLPYLLFLFVFICPQVFHENILVLKDFSCLLLKCIRFVGIFLQRGYLKTKLLCSYVHLNYQLFLEKETKKLKKVYLRKFFSEKSLKIKGGQLTIISLYFHPKCSTAERKKRLLRSLRFSLVSKFLKISYLPWM